VWLPAAMTASSIAIGIVVLARSWSWREGRGLE
jgi:hypothetical protein